MVRTDQQKQELIVAAKQKAFTLYEGKQVPHRSCGICIAATFNLPTAPYQALRRGGISGEGQCGAIKAGEMVLGQYFGDPDPTGPVTDTLREAMLYYQAEWKKRIDLGDSPDHICNNITAKLGDFFDEQRCTFCTNLASSIAGLVAETLVRFGADFEITPIEKK